jgi:hypothetical protein
MKLRRLLILAVAVCLHRSVAFYMYYWAYGSNMNPSILKTRTFLDESVDLKEEPAVLENHRLSFVIGPPSGPCAAVVREDTGSVVHGLLFKLPVASWPALLASEGVPLGYSVKKVPVKTYGGSTKIARTLMDSALSASRTSEGAPSERYLNLLKEGAEKNGIMSSYRDELDQVTIWDSK